MMEASEFDSLKKNIAENGLVEPIVIYEGQILDGRNRWLACKEVCVTPHFQDYTGDQPVSYVISKNLERRHLSKSQRAMLAVEFLPLLEEEARRRQLSGLIQNQDTVVEKIPQREMGKAREKAGEIVGASGRYVSDAKKIKSESPELADLILQGDMTVSEAKRQMNRDKKIEQIVENTVAPIEGVAKSMGRFPVIYADPPWRYDFSKSPSRDIENQYPTMTLEEICNLDVASLAHDDSVLFLWATSPKQKEALQVIESWGFEYKTQAVWVKDKMGMGYYFRQQHELLLVATKGNLPTCGSSGRVSSVIHSPRGVHSSKPDIVYEIIEQMYPDYRKVELFARQKTEGWVSWGNEV